MQDWSQHEMRYFVRDLSPALTFHSAMIVIGIAMVMCSIALVTYRLRTSTDDGRLEFDDCPPELQNERRNHRALLFLALLGFWIALIGWSFS